MQIAPLPDNEVGRLQALHRYRMVDTAGEAAFRRFHPARGAHL